MELLIKCAIIVHDIGKLNPFFQYRMAGDNTIRAPIKASYHAFPSAMIALCLGIYLRAKAGGKAKRSIMIQHLPFLLATSVYNHHSRTFQRLPESTTLIDYCAPMDESIKLDLLATFKQFFDHLTNNPYLRYIAAELKDHFGENDNAVMLLDFDKIISAQFGLSIADDEAADSAIIEIIERMKEEDDKASRCGGDYPLLFFVTGQVASALDNLDTWEAMTGRTSDAFIKGIPFDVRRQVHNPAAIIPPFISKVRKESPLNKYRDKFFATMKQYADNLNPDDLLQNRGKIYSVTAPCGIGKTLGILYLAFKLQCLSEKAFGHVPKVIYALPFISICDQVEEIAKDLLGLKGLSQTFTVTTHHHLADFGLPVNRAAGGASQGDAGDADNEASERGITDYEIDLWRSDLVITSAVRLFETMFRFSKNNLLRFNRLTNSVVILDEYHSIPLKYHDLIRLAMQVLSRHFNMQFIVATATTPAIFAPDELVEIVPNQARFFEGINRYRINYSPVELGEAEFYERMVVLVNGNTSKGKSVMIVVNKTARSRGLFLHLRARMDGSLHTLHHLSGKVYPDARKARLASIRGDLEAGKAPVLVTTQLIEAGIDVSFDKIVRDIGPLSSIVQVAGRCNRNAMIENPPVLDVVRVEDDADIYDAGSIQVTRNFFDGLGNETDEATLRARYTEYARLLRDGANKDACVAECRNLDFAGITRQFKMIDELDGINMLVVPQGGNRDAIVDRLLHAGFIPRDLLGKAITITLSEAKKVITRIRNRMSPQERRNVIMLKRDPVDGRHVLPVDVTRGEINEKDLLYIIVVLPCVLYDDDAGLVVEDASETRSR
jgi:CRISPR-associated helicase Cas3/CRISPR-associated endonuclease Cas3-HD